MLSDGVYRYVIRYRAKFEMAMANLEQTSSAWGRARRRVDGIHPGELFCKVPHIKFPP